MSKDAWKQEHDLHEKFTKEWDVRPDLSVVALACDRTVRFDLRYSDDGPLKMGRWHSTQRNVGTMRELANALLDACDFVEASNPKWTARKGEPDAIERVLAQWNAE
jgi:hypothetical protein